MFVQEKVKKKSSPEAADNEKAALMDGLKSSKSSAKLWFGSNNIRNSIIIIIIIHIYCALNPIKG